MAKTDKYIVLTADPKEGVWSILAQSDKLDDVHDTINADLKGDPSLRILLNTSNFITFEIGGEEDD